jgi:hypothetical protein
VEPETCPKASTDPPVIRIYEALRTPFSVYNSDNARLLNLFRFGIKLDKGRYGKYTLAALEPMEPVCAW